MLWEVDGTWPQSPAQPSCQIGHKNVQIRQLHNNAANRSRVELHEPRQLHVLPVEKWQESQRLNLQRAVDKRTRSTEASWTIAFGITSHSLC